MSRARIEVHTCVRDIQLKEIDFNMTFIHNTFVAMLKMNFFCNLMELHHFLIEIEANLCRMSNKHANQVIKAGCQVHTFC